MKVRCQECKRRLPCEPGLPKEATPLPCAHVSEREDRCEIGASRTMGTNPRLRADWLEWLELGGE